MPKQNSIIPVRGTLGEITYYTRNGKHFCRMKNITKSNTFRFHPSYAKQRQVIKRAARCMTVIYHLLPKEKRNAKRWASLLKCVNNPAHVNKRIDIIINDALLQFDIIHSSLPMAEREPIFQQIRSTLPFTSLDPGTESREGSL